MKLCTMSDFKDIKHIADNQLSLKALISSGALVYVNSEKTAIMIYIRINEFCLEAHVESLKECRGYKLKKFCIDSGIAAIKTDSSITSVLNFADKDNKALLLFSGTFAKRVGEVGDKILFVSERHLYLEGGK